MSEERLEQDEPEVAVDDAFVKVPEEVLLQHVADEMVLLDLRNGTYFGLDAIGTRMLDLARTHPDVDNVVAALEREFDATIDVLRADFVRLMDELSESGLVTLSNSD